MQKFLLILSLAALFTACKTVRPINKIDMQFPRTDAFLENLLSGYPQYFGSVLQKRNEYKVQVIYTQIDRKKNNEPVFTSYYFNVDPGNYFYPASTVKMPVALLALEEIGKLKHLGVNRNSSMITEADYSGQTPVYNDPTTPDGRPTVAHYIKKIFLVSDNDAFNRLYEFVGQEQINKRLREMGYNNASIVHRLSLPMSEDENRHTNPIRFYDDTTRLLHNQPSRFNANPYPVRNDSIGTGYYSGGKLVSGPMDFSKKNKISLPELNQMMQTILFPDAFAKKYRFEIEEDDHRFVRQFMSLYPREAGYPPYDTSNYHDAFCKFIYWGSEKGKLPENFRVFNKVGNAYGFLTDVAYVVDLDKKVEFMVSATIYCNSDGILNDDKYDYDSVGYPFMKQLGRVLYDFELKRKRKRVPDLSGLF
ncbi:MAG TPA: serine hydrolase [Chitinophagaceae bacterium]